MPAQVSTFRLKPAKEGSSVLDPETFAVLAEEGEDKPVNSYWLRRVRDGDVVVVGENSDASSKKPAQPAAKKAGGDK